jgi:hypothetical protein
MRNNNVNGPTHVIQEQCIPKLEKRGAAVHKIQLSLIDEQKSKVGSRL